MSDPVDTDALRAMAAAGDYNMGPFAVSAADEVDRLRAVIENAPHAYECFADFAQGTKCTCWKADAL